MGAALHRTGPFPRLLLHRRVRTRAVSLRDRRGGVRPGPSRISGCLLEQPGWVVTATPGAHATALSQGAGKQQLRVSARGAREGALRATGCRIPAHGPAGTTSSPERPDGARRCSEDGSRSHCDVHLLGHQRLSAFPGDGSTPHAALVAAVLNMPPSPPSTPARLTVFFSDDLF